jgi:hypothetical protein
VVFSHQSQISIRLHFTYGRYFTTRLWIETKNLAMS